MKKLKILYFCLFPLVAFISAALICNSFRTGGSGVDGVKLSGIGLAAFQAVAFFVVLLVSGRKMLKGVFVIASGAITMLSGVLVFATLGAPAPEPWGTISLACMPLGALVFCGMLAIGILMVISKPKNLAG